MIARFTDRSENPCARASVLAPPPGEIGEIQAGSLYVHCTSTSRWKGGKDILRTKGYVDSLGKGFYTYPIQTIQGPGTDSTFTEFIGYSNIEELESEDPAELRNALTAVRIVEVRPTTKVPVWRQINRVTNVDKHLKGLSSNGMLNFAAIEVGSAKETVWLNAKLGANNNWVYPVEDGSKFEYLEGNIRSMTAEEIQRFIDNVTKKKTQ